jgi:hypothetical protein
MKESSRRFGRRLLTRACAWMGSRDAPRRRGVAPRPVFAPRRDLVVESEDGLSVLLDGRLVQVAFPLDWRAGGAVGREMNAMAWIEALDRREFEAALLDWMARGDELDVAVDAARCVTWMQQLTVRSHRVGGVVAESARASIARDVRRVDLWIRLGGKWMERLEAARMLCWAGAWFEGREAEQWDARGMRWLERVLDRGLSVEGMIAGQNASEHVRTCALLLECRLLMTGTALEARLVSAIERACATLADLAHPDGGASSMFGGYVNCGAQMSAVLDAARRMCGIRVVRRPNVQLDEAGLCGWRDGRQYFLFGVGAVDGGRMDADALSIEWTLGCERVFVAGGEQFASIEIDGAGTARNVRRARLQVLPDGVVAEGISEPTGRMAGAPQARRLLRSTNAELRVEDRVIGGAGQEVRAQIVCHPLARVRQGDDGSVTVRRGETVLRLESTQPISIELATWKPDAGLEVETRRIVLHYGPAPCSGTIRITNLVAQPTEKLVTIAAPIS